MEKKKQTNKHNLKYRQNSCRHEDKKNYSGKVDEFVHAFLCDMTQEFSGLDPNDHSQIKFQMVMMNKKWRYSSNGKWAMYDVLVCLIIFIYSFADQV